MSQMVLITVLLLILINVYGFLYSLSITKYKVLNGRKIQSKVINYDTLLSRLPLIIFNVTILIIFNVIGITYFDYIFLREYNSVLVSFYQITIVLLVDDFFFYILHRIMHENKYIYKKIHKIHHRANVPIPFEYIYVHPLEWMSGMIGPFIGMYLIGGIAFPSYCCYLIIRNIHEIHIHSGIKTSKLYRLFPFYGNNEHHDIHHSKRDGNYASTFIIWDVMFGSRISD